MPPAKRCSSQQVEPQPDARPAASGVPPPTTTGVT